MLRKQKLFRKNILNVKKNICDYVNTDIKVVLTYFQFLDYTPFLSVFRISRDNLCFYICQQEI